MPLRWFRAIAIATATAKGEKILLYSTKNKQFIYLFIYFLKKRHNPKHTKNKNTFFTRHKKIIINTLYKSTHWILLSSQRGARLSSDVARDAGVDVGARLFIDQSALALSCAGEMLLFFFLICGFVLIDRKFIIFCENWKRMSLLLFTLIIFFTCFMCSRSTRNTATLCVVPRCARLSSSSHAPPQRQILCEWRRRRMAGGTQFNLRF